MHRCLLCLCLLGAALSAQAISPARQGAGGDGAQCPEVVVVDPAAPETAVAAPAEPAAPAASSPARGKSGGPTRSKAGARWHSFLPGMLK
jgi:hypothetical protein